FLGCGSLPVPSQRALISLSFRSISYRPKACPDRPRDATRSTYLRRILQPAPASRPYSLRVRDCETGPDPRLLTCKSWRGCRRGYKDRPSTDTISQVQFPERVCIPGRTDGSGASMIGTWRLYTPTNQNPHTRPSPILRKFAAAPASTWKRARSPTGTRPIY